MSPNASRATSTLVQGAECIKGDEHVGVGRRMHGEGGDENKERYIKKEKES